MIYRDYCKHKELFEAAIFRSGRFSHKLGAVYFDYQLSKTNKMFNFVDDMAQFMYDPDPDSNHWTISRKYSNVVFDIMADMFNDDELRNKKSEYVSRIKAIGDRKLSEYMLSSLNRYWNKF